MKKGQLVLYRVGRYRRITAIVRTVHRDGSVTVEPRHELGDTGQPAGGYIGGTFRLAASHLELAAEG